jgi:hypothetical protein
MEIQGALTEGSTTSRPQSQSRPAWCPRQPPSLFTSRPARLTRMRRANILPDIRGASTSYCFPCPRCHRHAASIAHGSKNHAVATSGRWHDPETISGRSRKSSRSRSTSSIRLLKQVLEGQEDPGFTRSSGCSCRAILHIQQTRSSRPHDTWRRLAIQSTLVTTQ